MKNILFLLLIASFTIVTQSCKKKTIDPIVLPETSEEENSDIKAFNTYLTAQLNTLNIPGISVTISKKDKILYNDQIGKANIQNNEALTKDHLFLMASASKIVTATALLQLNEYGHFALDDDINNHLPFAVSNPNSTTPITFRMLLTQSSGIADGSALENLYYEDYDSPLPLDYFVEEYLLPNGTFYNASENFKNFEPGTDYESSQAATTLMAYLVEQISSQDFHLYCENKIFTPMGMTQTYWKLNRAKQSGFPLASPYTFSNGQFNPLENYTVTHYPSIGLRTTGKDFMKLVSALSNDGYYNNIHVLDETTVDEMFTSQIPTINNQIGYHVTLLDPVNFLWGDDRSAKGASTIVAVGPYTELGIVIMTNEGNVDLNEILDEAYKLALKL
ncbi:serine hydrolase domain-containing protein [Brumimicrobium oceani]|uniref:Beta-lactamase-related domain-containing protein n=1 Tax=Brumimicrobium oceani TaxID=2100725 RepID=A0A2U2XE81_9FLAO|nr:serine hydrolase domain-containing protein [Brumimicrobium oceani]PWH86116.1 hypothetical protein DIT68_06055 [Brumimicrobium oceani]